MVYLIIILLLLFFIYRYDICGFSHNKKRVYCYMCLLFVLVSGFRYRIGLDSMQYAYIFYHQIPELSNLTTDDLFRSYSEPLFVVLLSFVKTFFGKYYILQLIQAAFVNVLLFIYIWKHTKNVFFCIFAYFLWKYFTYNMEEMRAGISVAICLFGNDYILKKKTINGVLLYVVATFFHYSAALLFITPFLMFLRMNVKSLIVIVAGFFGGLYIQFYFSDYMELFAFNEVVMSKMEGYSNSAKLFSQQVNFMGLIQYFIQFGLYSFFSARIVKNRRVDIMAYEPFLMMGLLFVVLSIPVPLFYRYINFYSLYFILFFSEHFVSLGKSVKDKGAPKIFFPAFVYMPFFFFVILSYTAKEPNSFSPSVRYYPYASIVEKSIDADREKYFNLYDVPSLSPNEY